MSTVYVHDSYLYPYLIHGQHGDSTGFPSPLVRLEVCLIRTILAAHAEVGDADDHVAVGGGHCVALYEPQEGDPTRQPRHRVECHRPRDDVRQKAAQLRHDPVHLHRQGELEELRPPRRDPAGRHVGLPDLGSAVQKAGAAAGGVGEGCVVAVVDAHRQVEGHVELQAQGGEIDARRDTGDRDGDELTRRFADLEDGKCEDDGSDD
ncbi:unnamed protein product [Musa banksii]